MVRSLPLLAALAGSALAAETTTVLNLLVLGDQSPFVGSIVNADATVTTVAVKCAPNTPSESCGLPPNGAAITQGQSTWMWNYGYSDPGVGLFTQQANCQLDPSNDVASCTVQMTQGSEVISSATAQSGYKSFLYPVTITAGVDKLSAAPGATATNGNLNTAKPTQTGLQTLTSQTGSASKTAAGATTTTSKNAGPAMTQNAVLAGVAAVIGGVLAM